jgi:hypothetical protein
VTLGHRHLMASPAATRFDFLILARLATGSPGFKGIFAMAACSEVRIESETDAGLILSTITPVVESANPNIQQRPDNRLETRRFLELS